MATLTSIHLWEINNLMLSLNVIKWVKCHGVLPPDVLYYSIKEVVDINNGNTFQYKSFQLDL